jgi:predicted tellurium resistance membrane protein TerC
MEWLNDPDAWIGLLTLTVLELVLGIDNIVFISILSGKLPARHQKKARLIGLSLAMLLRILLLLSISWVMGLTRPLFTIANFQVTGRAMILVAGGLFLLVKARTKFTTRSKEKTSVGKPGLLPHSSLFSCKLVCSISCSRSTR